MPMNKTAFTFRIVLTNAATIWFRRIYSPVKINLTNESTIHGAWIAQSA
jgi:hypothetical protein